MSLISFRNFLILNNYIRITLHINTDYEIEQLE